MKLMNNMNAMNISDDNILPHSPALFIGAFKCRFFALCGSTNYEALNDLTASDKSLFWAAEQTDGRGRRAKTWESPKGNLYASALFFIPSLHEIGLYSLAAALSLGQAFDALETGIDFAYKWPNDVLVNGKKIAGILLETADNPLRLVIGTGVNIISKPQGKMQYPATCLYDEGVKDLTLEKLLETYLSCLNFNIELIRFGEGGKIVTQWCEKSVSLNQPVKVKLAKGTLFGLFKGLDKTGSLILSCQGKDSVIPAGEILF